MVPESPRLLQQQQIGCMSTFAHPNDKKDGDDGGVGDGDDGGLISDHHDQHHLDHPCLMIKRANCLCFFFVQPDYDTTDSAIMTLLTPK